MAKPSTPHEPKLHKQQDSNGRLTHFVDKLDNVSNGDDITWEAPAGSTITIWFPPTRNPLGISPDPLPPGTSLYRKVQNVPLGRYPYSIYCDDTNTMAESNSPPEMIIV